ncbi:FmdB family zinc ribbon protein [Brevibacterium sp.]|uniref:FmdB family zinc ribbon protein n=1 Tax=Brevibacterium sp. TaxID=1701 RepID=UPI0028114557|nr:FmdB family zinc ribbon protein [Brevibacterium sp.]
MPVYSYACKSCGHAFDIHQDFSDDSLTICPECQGRLKKVFGTVGVSFKGSGFYATDSRSGSTSTSTAASKSSAKESSAAPSAPAAAAPAAS